MVPSNRYKQKLILFPNSVLIDQICLDISILIVLMVTLQKCKEFVGYMGADWFESWLTGTLIEEELSLLEQSFINYIKFMKH